MGALALTVLMAASGGLIGFAPNFGVYLLGRVLIGVVIGGFWSLSAATAMRLVPAAQVPRALAVVNGGSALATVLAAPLGSYLGSLVGWRGAFLCLVPIAIGVLAWEWFALPSLAAPTRTSSPRAVLAALRRRPIATGMAACGAFFMGQFITFTYVWPFLETVTDVNAATLSLVLLTVGVAGLIGTAFVERFIDRSLYRVLITIPAGMAGIALALLPFGQWLLPVFILLGLWGLLSTSNPVGWWTWVARAMPDDVEAGGGLMVATIQLSIALGSTFGGLLFDAAGHYGPLLASAGVLIAASVQARTAARATARDTAN